MATDQNSDGDASATDDDAPTPDDDAAATAAEEGLSDAGKRALAAERKARRDAEQWRKEHEDIVTRAKAQAEKDKSETQRLSDAVTEANARAAKAEASLLRYEVAAAKGVPSKLIRFLTGDSKEELEEAADVLLAEFGNGDRASSPTARPKERLVAGKPSASDEGKSTAQLAAEILDPL